MQAEFDTSLFHRRGTIAAARTNNAKRASSGTNFFINIGMLMEDSVMARHEARINNDRAFFYGLNLPENKTISERYTNAMAIDTRNNEMISHISDSLRALTSDMDGFEPYSIPEHHKEVYRTLGGNPFQDQRYMVFGDIIEGMDVVDSISLVPIDEGDWPIEDVRILSMHILK